VTAFNPASYAARLAKITPNSREELAMPTSSNRFPLRFDWLSRALDGSLAARETNPEIMWLACAVLPGGPRR
jgi:hypothetical protein